MSYQKFDTSVQFLQLMRTGLQPHQAQCTECQPVLGQWGSWSQEKWWAHFIFNLHSTILETTGVEDDRKKKNLKIASQFCCQIKKPIKNLGRAEGIIIPPGLCTTGVELSVPEDGSHSSKPHRCLRRGPVDRISNISLNLQRTLKTKGCSTSL